MVTVLDVLHSQTYHVIPFIPAKGTMIPDDVHNLGLKTPNGCIQNPDGMRWYEYVLEKHWAEPLATFDLKIR